MEIALDLGAGKQGGDARRVVEGFVEREDNVGNLAQLDRLLVGLSDGHGGFTGIGFLEHVPEDGGLRLISPVADPPKALRLGSVRLEDSFRAKRVDLRNLFGTE